jgi:alpha-galactosidase
VQVCGLCHGHYGYRQIASTLGLDPDRVVWQAPGLNHNIWLTRFQYEGRDAYPLLDAWIANESERYWREQEQAGGIPTQMSPAAIHQYRMFGLMPVGDTPRRGGWWYHVDLETRRRWYGGPGGGGDTPEGRERILRSKDEHYARMQAAAGDPAVRPVELFGSRPTSEQHIPLIDALANDHEGRFQVNVPNRGALPGLPDDVAVEVPAVADRRGIRPDGVDALPPKIMLEQILPDWLETEHTLEALRSGDRSMLLWGVLNSHQTRSYDQATGVVEALLAMPPTEPMAYLEDVNRHYRWPKGW